MLGLYCDNGKQNGNYCVAGVIGVQGPPSQKLHARGRGFQADSSGLKNPQLESGSHGCGAMPPPGRFFTPGECPQRQEAPQGGFGGDAGWPARRHAQKRTRRFLRQDAVFYVFLIL